jgi:hypothetical protein
MVTWDDVKAVAMALPEVEESTSYGARAWKVRKKTFAWARPLRKTEIKQLGGFEPEGSATRGDILGVRVPDEETKQALVSSRPEIYFTTPHFEGHASVLVVLERIPRADLEDAIVEAWLARAPKKLADAYLAERDA